MGIFSPADRSAEALVQAIKSKHPNLADFDIVIDKTEWR